MNDSPNRWRAIAAFTILASALSCTLAGCSNKTTTIPTGQTPPPQSALTRQLLPTAFLGTPQTRPIQPQQNLHLHRNPP